jgi:hypothetical protein
MRRDRRWIKVAAILVLVADLVGCTKRMTVPKDEYREVLGGEDFVYVTTTDGKMFELQEVQITDTSITGLLRHTQGDIKPVGAGGKEVQSAWIEIQLSDVQALEVERINKGRVFMVFGAVAGGLAAAIIAVKATGKASDGGGGGTPPIKP